MASPAEQRSEIRRALQIASPADTDERDADDEALEGAVCIGWTVVVEWMATDGQRWLSKFNGDAADEQLSKWANDGMLHHALHCEWPSSDE